jgi:hypothetical protein
VLGGLSIARSAGHARSNVEGEGPVRLRGATLAMALGTIATVLGAVFVVTADGGLGTGNGLSGAVVAIVLGLVGFALSVLAKARRTRL